MSETTFFKEASKYKSFDRWLTEIPEEDLQWLARVNDDVSQDKLADKDQDIFDNLVAIIIYFSGKQEVTEKELEDYWQLFTIDISLEQNIRQGHMVKTGRYSLRNSGSVRVSLTDKGMKHVQDMLNDKMNNGR